MQFRVGIDKLDITLDDASDLLAAQTLFKAIYGVPYVLQDADQDTLLRLMLLAEKYDVPRVLQAASTGLQKLSGEISGDSSC